MLFTPSTRKNYGYDLFVDFFNDSFFTAPAARTTSDLMRTDVKDAKAGKRVRTRKTVKSGSGQTKIRFDEINENI